MTDEFVFVMLPNSAESANVVTLEEAVYKHQRRLKAIQCCVRVDWSGFRNSYSSVAGNGTGIERYIGTVHPSRKIWRSNSKWYPWRPKRNIVLCLYSMGFIEYYEDEETGIQHTQPAEDECVMRACRKVGVETSDYHPPSKTQP